MQKNFLTRAHDIASRRNEMLSRAHEIGNFFLHVPSGALNKKKTELSMQQLFTPKQLGFSGTGYYFFFGRESKHGGVCCMLFPLKYCIVWIVQCLSSLKIV